MEKAGEPNHAGGSGNQSVWWTWTAPISGSVTISTVESRFDTDLAIYTGSSVSNLTLIASDRNSGQLSTSIATFNVSAGTAYQIAVSSGTNKVEVVKLAISIGVPQIINRTSGTNPGSGFKFRVVGDPNQNFAIEKSGNLTSWLPVLTNNSYNGQFDFQDATVTNGLFRFYRARKVP